MTLERERALVAELAAGLRERVLPALGAHAGRAHAGVDAVATGRADGVGGDVTFEIDADAEAFLEEFVARRAPDLAFYSEDRGLVEPAGGARHVLIVDPIDGTRPALAGFEAACVSIALAPLDGEPRMGDVLLGCVVEIKTGARFFAQRGAGLQSTIPVRLSRTVELGRLFWTYGLRGRPARPTIEVLADLIDRSSVGGATFELGSATYDMTRVLTGQLDAYIEPGPRLIAEVPGMREQFERVGGGHVLNNSPYDLAAAALCAREGGAVVTDAAGAPLDERPLLGSGAEFQMSVVMSASAPLHERLIAEIDNGIDRLAQMWARPARFG